MIDNIDNRIKIVLDLCQQVNELIKNWGEPSHRKADKDFWECLKALNEEAGTGLQVGKHVRFSIADGYAHYIVRKVGVRKCQLVHIPYMDGYRSRIVGDNGDVNTDEIKPRIEFEEGIKRLFEIRHTRKMTVAAE